MHISSFRIRNFKSFLDSGEIVLQPGFNVIVGANNAGKTALLEALSLNGGNKPHRSLATVPDRISVPPGASETDMTISFDPGEILAYIPHRLGNTFDGPYSGSMGQAEAFLRSLEHSSQLTFSKHGGGVLSASILDHAVQSGQSVDVVQGHFLNGKPVLNTSPTSSTLGEHTLPLRLAAVVPNLIYVFRAERLNVAIAPMGPDTELKTDASNLAQVLNVLQSNPARYREFNKYVTTIFPDITQISAPPIDASRAQIMVWAVDPETQREDLALPLSECGTGIGQILAMIYVVMMAPTPRTIVIDEPQSFLHPGAVRKLFDILRRYPQHQFIVTTHSPTAVTAARAARLLLVRKEGSESRVEALDGQQAEDLNLFLSEIGARLSDVFGADNILWVEGLTEETCFPLILQKAGEAQFGTVILGVLNTGDFNGKRARTTFEVYQRLSSGRGLLPPAIGFLFDRELLDEKQRNDIVRQSRGTVHFLPRRMYENYLIDADAIAEVLRGTEGFPNSELSAATVQAELDRISVGVSFEEGRNDLDGAGILATIFKNLSGGIIWYLKVEHGAALTKWLLDHKPDALKEVTELLKGLLGGELMPQQDHPDS